MKIYVLLANEDLFQVVNGIVPDGRALMYRGREEAKQYNDNFGIKIPGHILAERLGNVT